MLSAIVVGLLLTGGLSLAVGRRRSYRSTFDSICRDRGNHAAHRLPAAKVTVCNFRMDFVGDCVSFWLARNLDAHSNLRGAGLSGKPVTRSQSALRRSAVFLGVGITAAAAMLVSASPASGATAQELISPSVSISVSPEHSPNLIVFGEGCVDAAGHSGTVSIAYTTPGQEPRTFVVPQLGLYPDGSWAADIPSIR